MMWWQTINCRLEGLLFAICMHSELFCQCHWTTSRYAGAVAILSAPAVARPSAPAVAIPSTPAALQDSSLVKKQSTIMLFSIAHLCAFLHPGGALPPLYVFPSGLAYHGSCCAAEVQVRTQALQFARFRCKTE